MMPKNAATIITVGSTAPHIVHTYQIDHYATTQGFDDLWCEALPSYIKYRMAGRVTPARYTVDDLPKTSDDLIPCRIKDWAMREHRIETIGGAT